MLLGGTASEARNTERVTPGQHPSVKKAHQRYCNQTAKAARHDPKTNPHDRYCARTGKAARHAHYHGPEFKNVHDMAMGVLSTKKLVSLHLLSIINSRASNVLTNTHPQLLYYQHCLDGASRSHIVIVLPTDAMETLHHRIAVTLDEKFKVFSNGIIITGLTVTTKSPSYDPDEAVFKNSSMTGTCLLAFANGRSRYIVDRLIESLGYAMRCGDGCTHEVHYCDTRSGRYLRRQCAPRRRSEAFQRALAGVHCVCDEFSGTISAFTNSLSSMLRKCDFHLASNQLDNNSADIRHLSKTDQAAVLWQVYLLFKYCQVTLTVQRWILVENVANQPPSPHRDREQ